MDELDVVQKVYNHKRFNAYDESVRTSYIEVVCWKWFADYDPDSKYVTTKPVTYFKTLADKYILIKALQEISHDICKSEGPVSESIPVISKMIEYVRTLKSR